MALDTHLRVAIVVGLVLRILPLALWPSGCTRDGCTYTVLAQAIVDGKGFIAAPNGWVWAPGYPVLLALCQKVFLYAEAVKGVQVALFPLSAWAMFRVAARVEGGGAAAPSGTPLVAARWAAWLLALHPTLIYFTGEMWSESVYTTVLIGAVLSLLWARDGRWTRALVPGALVGLCVMFRGVATYMAPIFAVVVVWPAVGESVVASVRARWGHALAVLLAVGLVVAPYAGWASARFGGFLISDATLGQMMWLGNNDFDPITFDYGNGLNVERAYAAHTAEGRGHCDDALPAALWNACEVDAGKAWIRAHPEEFARRIPLRLAQLLNPHTFLTRHVRWGKWSGLPYLLNEALVVWIAAWSALMVVGGTIAVCLRGRGPYGVLSVGIVTYHVLAVACLAGLTRYRVPLEPLWIVWIASVAASPRDALAALRVPWRVIPALVLAAALVPLMLWFLPTGFPGFW
jgi:hypothetical protein